METCVRSTIPCRKSARNTGRDRGCPVPTGTSSSLSSSLVPVLLIDAARSWLSASRAACNSAFSFKGCVSRKDCARSMACGTSSSSPCLDLEFLPRPRVCSSRGVSSAPALSFTCTPSTSTTIGLEYMADGIVTRSLRTLAFCSLNEAGSWSRCSSFCADMHVSHWILHHIQYAVNQTNGDAHASNLMPTS